MKLIVLPCATLVNIFIEVEASLEINTAVPLMKEATKVLHTVQNVWVDKSKIHEFELHHPKQEDDDQTDLPLHGYTYMKWPFGSNRTLLTRGQLHGYLKKGGNFNLWELNQINISYISIRKPQILYSDINGWNIPLILQIYNFL